jgi:rhodanese-related sulfurtransferase
MMRNLLRLLSIPMLGRFKMKVKTVDATTAKQWLDKNQAILIDVREPAEYASKKISGAKLHPVGSISVNGIPQTDKKILIYCQKGARGSNACQKLMTENEALEVYNIEGGIEAWQQAGLATESS